MNQPNVSVLLSEEQSQEFKSYVYQLVSEAAENAKREAGVSQKWLRKKPAADYAGVSISTLNTWVRNGLTCHIIDGVTIFNKGDIDSLINNDGLLTK